MKETSSFFSRGHAVFDEWTAADDGGLADAISAFFSSTVFKTEDFQLDWELTAKLSKGKCRIFIPESPRLVVFPILLIPY